MLKYLSKITMDILPSVVATILGAYIVNHYISNKADAPPVAAAVAPATTIRPDSAPADVASLPQAGVHAKGISEKSVFEKPITAKPVEKPQEKPEEKAAEKTPERSEDKPAETASIPAEPKRPAAPREKEKTSIRNIPLTASPAVQPATTTVPANPPATVEAAVTPEERRDANANDLARAAIERLRGSHPSETTRAPEAPRVAPASQQASAPVRPLPPPIMVSTPPAEQPGPFLPAQQPYPNAARQDDPNRPTPPADIPGARPLDLQAGAAPLDPLAGERRHTNVAEDVLTGVKSMFHAVLPQ